MGDRRPGTEQSAFYPAEDRGIRTDGEGEAENGEGGKSWRAAQLAKTVAPVLAKIAEQVSPACLAALLFNLGEAAQGAQS